MVKRSRIKSLGIEGHSRGVEERPDANQQALQMCLIHSNFKHLLQRKANDFRFVRKVSSIMSAKVLSIMTAGDAGLTSLFKPIRTRLGYGLTHRPGT
jgi:hypothetical protein